MTEQEIMGKVAEIIYGGTINDPSNNHLEAKEYVLLTEAKSLASQIHALYAPYMKAGQLATLQKLKELGVGRMENSCEEYKEGKCSLEGNECGCGIDDNVCCHDCPEYGKCESVCEALSEKVFVPLDIEATLGELK